MNAEDGVAVACSHKVFYSPTPKRGDIVWCHSCNDYVLVTQSPVDEHTDFELYARCLDCAFVRYGEYLDDVTRLADRHSIKQNHVVEIRKRNYSRTLRYIRPPEQDQKDVTKT